MSRYHLSEAYSELYNPRKTEEIFYENLKFVDYLLDEHIEEVIESVYWEFRDYGNSIDEAFELIDYSLSDVVIAESLMEATVTSSENRPQSGSAQVTSSSGRFRTTPKYGGRAGERKSRIDIAKRKVKSAIGTGLSKVKQVGTSVAGAVGRQTEKAKAALTGLVRRGAQSAGSRIRRAGENIEKLGTPQASTPRSNIKAIHASRRSAADSRRSAASSRTAENNRIRAAGRERMFDREERRKNKRDVRDPRHPFYSEFSVSGTGAIDYGAPKGMALPPVGASSRTPSGNIRPESQRKFAISRASKAGRKLMKEDIDLLVQYILEDLISEGYADTVENAFVILENLSEDLVEEMVLQYLEN
jgi:hypothetical protein